MGNKFIFDSLNEETQDYLRIVFSLIDYFHEQSFDQTDAISYSFFIAGLYKDGIIKDYFNSKDVTYERCLDSFNIQNVDIKARADETASFDKIDLSTILSNALNEVAYDYYLEEKGIKVHDLEPFQLFDYTMMTYYEPIEELFNKEFDVKDLFASDIFEEYDGVKEKEYARFASNYGVDIYEKSSEENIDEYDLSRFNIIFDNGNMILIINDGSNSIDVPIQSNNKQSVTLYKTTEVLKINGKPVTKKVFEEFINSFDNLVFCNFTIQNTETKEEETFTAFKEDIFGNIKLNENKKDNSTPVLDKYGEDLTKISYLKDPAVGRNDEIKKIMQVLLYPEKDKSIIITGDAGCGKTALVRGLAYRIQNGEVPESLKNLRIISIDTSSIVAGTKYVGTLEEKMKSILNEASKDKNIIIFIDEIHQALSGGKAEGNDNSVAEILKPYLDYGKVRIIGATTTEEYEEYVEPNTAFKTRLKKIAIKEPNDKVTYEIIDSLIESYNKIADAKLNVNPFQKRRIIEWLIDSTKNSYRLYNDKMSNPRLVLDIVKEAYAIAAVNGKTEVTINELCEALMCEDRLYDSSRARQSSILKSSFESEEKPKHDCKILEFKPKTK